MTRPFRRIEVAAIFYQDLRGPVKVYDPDIALDISIATPEEIERAADTLGRRYPGRIELFRWRLENGCMCFVARAGEKIVAYDFADIDEIILAYAISVHKSQGSEYPVVIMPVSMQHYRLLERCLIYTTVTRAKRLVILVGSKEALGMAIRNNRSQRRFTGLKRRLQHVSGD